MLDEDGSEAFFAIGYQNTVLLFTMNTATGHVISSELKESYIVPRILSNLTNALRYIQHNISQQISQFNIH